MNRHPILFLLAITLLAGCAATAVMPPAVTPSGDDRFLPDPRLGYRDTRVATTEERFEAAWRYFLAGNDAEARRLLSDIQLKTPGYLPATLAVAAIDIRAGKLDEAERVIARIRDLDPTYTAARVYEAELAYRRRETRQALELYRGVAALPDAPAFAADRVRELEATTFNELLAAAQTASDAEAARLLREALAVQPAATEARLLLTQRLIASKQYEEARRELEPLLTTDAARNEVQEALAEIDLGRGKFEEAINRYDRLSRRTREPRYARRLEEIKVEWSAANMPPQYRTALESESLTRADFAVLLYWTVPSVRFAQRLATPPIAIDIAEVSGREEIIRAIAIGLYDVDAVTRRVSPYRQINAASLVRNGARVLTLRGAACARQVPFERDETDRAEKILAACGVANPAAGADADAPITGRAAQRMLEQIAKQL